MTCDKPRVDDRAVKLPTLCPAPSNDFRRSRSRSQDLREKSSATFIPCGSMVFRATFFQVFVFASLSLSSGPVANGNPAVSLFLRIVCTVFVATVPRVARIAEPALYSLCYIVRVNPAVGERS